MSNEAEVGKSLLSKPTDREIRVERVFDAPPERVWAALTDPEQVVQWWGPRNYRTEVEQLDVRVGGAWCLLNIGEGDDVHRFRGYYREVEPHSRISQTFEWEGMPGYVCLETATLEDLGGRTKLVSVSVFFAQEERDGMLESGMEEGMNESYERLDELLAAG